MNQVELLRHVADNLEAGRPVGHGLLYRGKKSSAIYVQDIPFGRSDAYSLAPRTRIINGVEVPAPMGREPDVGSGYWCEMPGAIAWAFCTIWTGEPNNKMRFERGLCYDSAEAAAANCRARYGLQPAGGK